MNHIYPPHLYWLSVKEKIPKYKRVPKLTLIKGGYTEPVKKAAAPPPPPPPPEQPKSNVIKLVPKKVQQRNQHAEAFRDVFLRRQNCAFDNAYNGGCGCNYCAYFSMMSQRVFEVIRSDMFHQARAGKMRFMSQDMLQILQGAIERVISYEKSQQGPPPPPTAPPAG